MSKDGHTTLLLETADSGSVEEEMYEDAVADPSEPQRTVPSFFDDYEAMSGVPTRILHPADPESRFTCHAFSADGSRMATGETNGTIRLWKASNYGFLAEAKRLFEQAVDCVRFVMKSLDVLHAVDVKGNLLEIKFEVSMQEEGPSVQTSLSGMTATILRELDVNLVSDEGRRVRTAIRQFSNDGRTLLCATWGEECLIQVFRIKSSDLVRITPVFNHHYCSFPVLSPNGRSLLVCSASRDALERSDGSSISSSHFRLSVWPTLQYSHLARLPAIERPGVRGCWGLDGEYLLVWVPFAELLQLQVLKIEGMTGRGDSSIQGSLLLEDGLADWKAQMLNRSAAGKHLTVLIYAISTSGRRRFLVWDVTEDIITREVNIELPSGSNIDRPLRKFRGVPVEETVEVGMLPKTPEAYFFQIMEGACPKFCASKGVDWAGVFSWRAHSCAIVSVRSQATVWSCPLPEEVLMDPSQMWNQTCFDPFVRHFLVFGDSAILACAPSFLQPDAVQRRNWNLLPSVMLEHSNETRKIAADLFHDLSSEALAQILTAQIEEGVRTSSLMANVLQANSQIHYVSDAALSPGGHLLAFIAYLQPNRCVLHTVNLEENSRSSIRAANALSPPYAVAIERFVPGRVFLYENESNPAEIMVLFPVGYKAVAAFCDIENCSMTKVDLEMEKCIRISQTEDCRSLLLLDTGSVCVLDLKLRQITRRIQYASSLGKAIRLTGASRSWHHCKNKLRDKNSERRISDDGESVLLGWDTKNNRSIVVTPSMEQRECEELIAASDKSLSDMCMLSRNAEYTTFVDCADLPNGRVTVGIYSEKGKRVAHRICVLQNLPAADLSHEEVVLVLSNLFYDVSSDGTKLMTATAVLGSSQSSFTLKEGVCTFSVYGTMDCLPDYETLTSSSSRNAKDVVEEVFERHGSSVFNFPHSKGMTVFQKAFLDRNRPVIDSALRLARSRGFQLAMEFFPVDDPPSNLLQRVLMTSSTNDITEALGLACSDLTPFSSAASILKDTFKTLLADHRYLVESSLSSSLLSRVVCKLKVHVDFLNQKQSEGSAVRVHTSGTSLEWSHISEPVNLEKTWGRRNTTLMEKMEKTGNRSTASALLRFVCIQDAAKLGMRGILRPLLMHDIPDKVFTSDAVAAVIQFKWFHIWKKRILKEAVWHCVFLAVFALYVWMFARIDQSFDEAPTQNCLISVVLAVSFVFACGMLLEEITQIRSFMQDGQEQFKSRSWGMRYFFASWWNWIDVVSCLLLLVPIPYFHIRGVVGLGWGGPLSVFVAAEAILASIKVWYFAQAFSKTGALVLMINNIYKDCLPFFGLAALVLGGFSFAMYAVFSHKSVRQSDAELVAESFGSLPDSFLTMFYALLGGFEPEVYRSGDGLDTVITMMFVAYMITEMVVFLNLLIALMGDTFDRVKHTEQAQVLLGRARIMDACEAALVERDRIEIERKTIGKYTLLLEKVGGDDSLMEPSMQWMGRMRVLEESLRTNIRKSEQSLIASAQEQEKRWMEHSEGIAKSQETRWTEQMNRIVEIQGNRLASQDTRMEEISNKVEHLLALVEEEAGSRQQLASAVEAMRRDTDSQFQRLSSLLEEMRERQT